MSKITVDVHWGTVECETRVRPVVQSRLICDSGAKEKGALWFGTLKGRKAVHLEMEKQMFGK